MNACWILSLYRVVSNSHILLSIYLYLWNNFPTKIKICDLREVIKREMEGEKQEGK